MKTQDNKKIHIRLPEDLHKKLRVKCAYEDISVQEFVEHLIRESIGEYSVEQALKETGLKGSVESTKIGDN